jgi:hypothetical protein
MADAILSRAQSTGVAWSRLDSRMQDRLLAMFRASGGRVWLNEGYRTTQQQEAMFRDRYRPGPGANQVTWNGQLWHRVKGSAAAPPGASMHEIGLAADLGGDLKWMNAHAAEFGLRDFHDVNGEPWHVQPAELPKSRREYEANGSSWGAPPTDLAGIRKWMDSSERVFNTYLKTLPTDQQQKIIGELNQPRDLAGLSQYLSGAPQGVKDYVKYLSQLPADQMNAAKSRLGVQHGGAFDQPGAVPDDPAGSLATSNMLQDLGVSYPNAPQPTPALQAFLNSLGLNLHTAEQLKQRALDRIDAASSDAMADIERASGRNKQNVTADLIRRNVVSSGEATTRYGRQAEDVADQQAKVQTATKDQKVAATDIYEQSRSLIRQQALDRAITVEQDQATQKAASKAQDDSFRRQQDAADLAFARQQQAQQDALQQQKDLLAQQAAQGFAQ